MRWRTLPPLMRQHKRLGYGQAKNIRIFGEGRDFLDAEQYTKKYQKQINLCNSIFD